MMVQLLDMVALLESGGSSFAHVIVKMWSVSFVDVEYNEIVTECKNEIDL
jgi:hypothetical protein